MSGRRRRASVCLSVASCWACALVEAGVVLTVDRSTTSLQPTDTIDFSSLPSREFTASELGAPEPLLPFVVLGRFQTLARYAQGVLSFLSNDITDGAQSSRGLKLFLDDDGRLNFEVSHASAGGAAVSRSQRGSLNDGVAYDFMLMVTADRVQLQVDGLMGISASRATFPCHVDEPCTFSQDWAARAAFVAGGHGESWTTGSATSGFVGTIVDVGLRRLRAGEEPRATAGDGLGQQPEVVPGASGAEQGSADYLFGIIVIPCLLLALGVLILIGLFCVYSRRQRAAAASAAAPSSMSSAKVGPADTTIQVVSAVKYGAPPPPVPAPDAVAAAGVASAQEPDAEIELPAWWSCPRSADGPSELVPLPFSSAARKAVQDLMDSTWKQVVTKDRKALNAGHTVKRFEVVQVSRNENPKLWREYVKRRRSVAGRMKGEDRLTNVLTAGASEDLGVSQACCNEYLMFHGTKPSACDNICQNDFLLKLAGSHRGTLYGSGLYFAESASKADEYASDESAYKGLYAMLLCRVTLGRSLYTDEAFPDGKMLLESCTAKGAQYDSVLGDREKTRGTYREFVVYNGSQAYPEYVVIYRREDEAESAKE